MRKLFCLFFVVSLFASCISGKKDHPSAGGLVPEHPVVIIYENDVHCAVDGYAKMVTVREQQKAMTPYVTTVSCGDYIQGGLVGAVSEGDYIIDIMNKVGYDVVIPGNHEFDFGLSQMVKLMEKIKAEVVSANFHDLQKDQTVFPAYEILSYGELDIAFLGLTTTTTLSDSPNKFKNEEGQFIYDFSKVNFYETAQTSIDQARKDGADYVVVLSHLGESFVDDHPTSYSLIAKTTGIDVVLDAHTHRYLPDTLINNRVGESVLMSSTGSSFESVGILTLSTNGVFKSRLEVLKDVAPHAEIKTFVTQISEQVEMAGNEAMGISKVSLPTHDKAGRRMVRNQETCIGNFCADAFRVVLETDVALLNGGGIRDSISQGDLTFNDLKKVFPFGNKAATGMMTGQQICDALEFSAKDYPCEFGEFLHVSGLTFEVDASISSPVLVDVDGLFAGVGNGQRRVSNIRVLNSGTGDYEALDLKKEYSVSSLSFLLTESGGQGILSRAEVVGEDMGQDVEVLSIYVQLYLDGVIGNQYASVEERIRITQEACVKD